MLNDYKDKELHHGEYKLMYDLKKKFNKLEIPFYMKNAIVEVFSYKRNDSNSIIKMEVLSGSRL